MTRFSEATRQQKLVRPDRRRGAAVHPAVRGADGRQRLGADHRHRAPLRAARARPEHRRRLRRPARPRLRRLLRGRRLHAGPARLAAAHRHLRDLQGRLPERPAHAVVGRDSARRAGRRRGRRSARRADAEAARRLPRDRHARLRRDRARLPEQPRRAGQHHQRSEGHHRHRRDLDLRRLARQDAALLRPRMAQGHQLLLPVPAPGPVRSAHLLSPRAQPDRPRLDGDPRGRGRGQGDGHQHAQPEAARVRHGRHLRRRLGDDVRELPGLHLARVVQPAGVDHDRGDGRPRRHRPPARRHRRFPVARRAARGAALRRRAAAADDRRPARRVDPAPAAGRAGDDRHHAVAAARPLAFARARPDAHRRRHAGAAGLGGRAAGQAAARPAAVDADPADSPATSCRPIDERADPARERRVEAIRRPAGALRRRHHDRRRARSTA